MMPPLEEILEQAELLRGATSIATGDIFRWESQGHSYIVKTFARRGWLSRHIFGYAGIKNEWRLLTGLWQRGFRCAPEPVGKIGNDTIVMEFVQGTPLKSAKHYRAQGEAMPSVIFYQRLKEMVFSLHRTGISHGDFRRANIIVQENGVPRIIDWATGMLGNGLIGFTHRQFLSSDLVSLIKIIDEAHPELLSDKERNSIQPGIFLKTCTFLRQKIYRGIIKPLRKKRKSLQKK